MVLRYCENAFKENYIMTIGSNFSTKTVTLPEYPNFSIRLQLWDLAGQQHFSFVRPPFYRGAAGIVYVFDLTRRSSFANLMKWKDEVEKVVGGDKPTVLVGNKLDLANKGGREIAQQDGDSLKKELKALLYLEASAKEGAAVNDVFREITLAILKQTAKI